MNRLYSPVIETLMRWSPGVTRKAVFSGIDLACRWQQRKLTKRHRSGSGIPGDGRITDRSVEVMGLRFPNAIGIAAGFDRDGSIGRRIGVLGFGYMEIGTLTPDGEGQRNLTVLQQLSAERASEDGRLGINVGRRAQGSLLQGIDDYLRGVTAAWPVADYIAINLGGPAGHSYLDVEHSMLLEQLLHALKTAQWRLQDQYDRYVPIVFKLKVPPQPEAMLPLLLRIRDLRFEGVIAAEDGGKSAQRMTSKVATERLAQQQQICQRLAYLKQQLGDQVDVISVGAIADLNEANMRLAAGASLVQVHNALVYRGPSFFRELKQHCRSGN